MPVAGTSSLSPAPLSGPWEQHDKEVNMTRMQRKARRDNILRAVFLVVLGLLLVGVLR